MKTIAELLVLKEAADIAREEALELAENKINEEEMDALLGAAANDGQTALVVTRKIRASLRNDLIAAGFNINKLARSRWRVSWA